MLSTRRLKISVTKILRTRTSDQGSVLQAVCPVCREAIEILPVTESNDVMEAADGPDRFQESTRKLEMEYPLMT